MSMSSATSKLEDQQYETTHEKPSDETTTVTLRSWLYALLGCMLYFVISFHLAATSQWRTAQGTFLDPTKNSIWLLNVVSIFQACLGPIIMSFSDIVGRRYPLIGISAVAVLGSALSASATSWTMALIGQCLASIGLASIGAGYAIPSEVMRESFSFLRPSFGAELTISTLPQLASGAAESNALSTPLRLSEEELVSLPPEAFYEQTRPRAGARWA